MSKKNQYEKKAAKQSLLGSVMETQDTKGNATASAIEMGKDLLIGVIGGGVVSALIGKGPVSLVAGAVLTGVGHYKENRLLTSFGMGLMAAPIYQKASGMGSTEKKTMLEGAKERLLAFKDSLSEKFFLDKILKKKADTKTETQTSGVGEVQYFTYPDQQNQLAESDNMNALEELERQIAENATAFSRKQPVKGTLSGGEAMGELDPQEQNY